MTVIIKVMIFQLIYWSKLYYFEIHISSLLFQSLMIEVLCTVKLKLRKVSYQLSAVHERILNLTAEIVNLLKILCTVQQIKQTAGPNFIYIKPGHVCCTAFMSVQGTCSH